jgi:putative phosphoribosyl transferase
MSLPLFRDRHEAGRRLAEALGHHAPLREPVVLALPRGGVPVGWEVARALGAPLDVMVVRKLGVPGHEELAMGAIASGGIRVVSDEVVQALAIPAQVLADTALAEEDELLRQERAFRGERPAVSLAGHTVVLVDDGLATGSTMLAGIVAVRARAPLGVLVAVPVAPRETCRALRAHADEVLCLHTPSRFRAVGDWYDDFTQVDDAEVRRLLGLADSPA